MWKNRHNNQSKGASCILQCGNPFSASDLIDKITLKKWKKKQKYIWNQNKKWTGLDTFESVFTTADWKLGPASLFMHDSCYTKLCRPRQLARMQYLRIKVALTVAQP